MTNLIQLTFLEVVKIWWSITWRNVVYIILLSCSILAVGAFVAFVWIALTINDPLGGYLGQTFSSMLEIIENLVKEPVDSLQFKPIKTILLSALMLPIFLEAFKDINDICYKRFTLKLRAKTNYYHRFYLVTPYYASLTVFNLITEYGQILMLHNAGYIFILTIIDLVFFVFMTRYWLTRLVAKGEIILEPRAEGVAS